MWLSSRPAVDPQSMPYDAQKDLVPLGVSASCRPHATPEQQAAEIRGRVCDMVKKAGLTK